MKLLRVAATHYKNCCDNFTIDFIARSKKTSEDKEYELNEIADDLFVYNTLAFVGKNASGKTSAIELLDGCYSILGEFRLENSHYNYDGVSLELIFYHEKFIYRYTTLLKADLSFRGKVNFTQMINFFKVRKRIDIFDFALVIFFAIKLLLGEIHLLMEEKICFEEDAQPTRSESSSECGIFIVWHFIQ